MRIGIDARFYGNIGKGLGRYTQKLIENLERIDKKNRYFIFLRRENFDEYQPRNGNFTKVLADYRWYTFSEQIRMPLLLNRYRLDLVHFPHFNVPVFYRNKFVITIHDLILLHFPTLKGTTLPSFFYWIKFSAYRLVIRSAVRRALKIFAVSEFTKNDILTNYAVPEDKIAVTHEACDDFCRISHYPERDILKRYGIMKPYLLYVGNAYPHKNLDFLTRVFRNVREAKKDLELVLVGKDDFFYKRLKKAVASQNAGGVVFTGFIPDGDLDVVYKNAQVYVFPSLYEGFGLPPLEAMAKGVPVASSDHPCMREILADSAFYFDATDVDSAERAV